MNAHQYRFLLSERATLAAMIDNAPVDSIITRASLAHRLDEVENELADYSPNFSSRLGRARLTFSGNPVAGSRGIEASFGGAAVKAFADSVKCIGASQRTELAAMGPVPGGDNYKLLITGIAPGSFGFEVEDSSGQLALEGLLTPVEVAIDRVKSILEATVGTDDELADAIAEADGRALSAVHDFLKKVADDEAVCALEFGGDIFRFRDADQVRRSATRLSQDNILQADVTLGGRFQGYLPKSRRAEFLISDASVEFMQEMVDTVITATVEACVDEDVHINKILNTNVSVSARTKRVGSGRPRLRFFHVAVTT